VTVKRIQNGARPPAFGRRGSTPAALAAALLAFLPGCGNDPLAVSCADFMSKDAATQLSLATTWGAPNRDHIGALERAVAPSYRDDLLRYCPGHPDAQLNQLTLHVGG
jgi:hypothetical protein